MGQKYFSKKRFDHNAGLSCCFRQHRADSHCNKLHGYALAVEFLFACDELDHRNWVVDFGAFDNLKEWLKNKFDHKTLVAVDDPQRGILECAAQMGVLDIVLVDRVGCEAFAKMVYDAGAIWLQHYLLQHGMPTDSVHLTLVKVEEHTGNGATFWSVPDEQ